MENIKSGWHFLSEITFQDDAVKEAVNVWWETLTIECIARNVIGCACGHQNQ